MFSAHMEGFPLPFSKERTTQTNEAKQSLPKNCVCIGMELLWMRNVDSIRDLLLWQIRYAVNTTTTTTAIVSASAIAGKNRVQLFT